MKQYLIISIGMILFGLSSTYLIEFINHWFLLGCFAIFCSSVFVLFAQSPKEAIVFYLMYSVSFLLSRYLLTSFDLAPVFYFITISGFACLTILFLTRPGVKMNALRSFAALVFILFLMNQPRSVFYIGLVIGILTFVNLSLQASRTDFSKKRFWKDRTAHRNFQERIAARNRLTTLLIVQSVCAEYNKLDDYQYNSKTPLL